MSKPKLALSVFGPTLGDSGEYDRDTTILAVGDGIFILQHGLNPVFFNPGDSYPTVLGEQSSLIKKHANQESAAEETPVTPEPVVEKEPVAEKQKPYLDIENAKTLVRQYEDRIADLEMVLEDLLSYFEPDEQISASTANSRYGDVQGWFVPAKDRSGSDTWFSNDLKRVKEVLEEE